MKLISVHTSLLLMTLIAGCASTGEHSVSEKPMGTREQLSRLAKARPLQDFGFAPSYPFGNRVLYIGATMLVPNQSATMTFQPGGAPVIEMKGSSPRKPMKVLLDTSSNSSWMQYSCAAKNDAIFLQHNGAPIHHLDLAITKGVNSFAGVVPLLHIDRLALHNAPFYIRMAKGTMEPFVYNTPAPQVDAVLGYDNLRQLQYIQFSMREGAVRFSSSAPYMPNSERLMGEARISNQRRDCLAVEGSIFEQPVPIILDFAGDYGFARGDAKEQITRQVALGEVVYINVPTVLLPMQDLPRAGRKMLEKYVVTVCPREGVVYFERPPENP